MAVTALVLASCVSKDKIRMVEVEDFTMVDETRLEVTVRIENRNGSNLTLRDASVSLVADKAPLVTLALDGKVVIPRHSDQGLLFPVDIRMSDPAVLSTLSEKAINDRSMTVQGQLTGQVGIFSKRYKIGPMPVEEFLNMLDEENREMIKGFIY